MGGNVTTATSASGMSGGGSRTQTNMKEILKEDTIRGATGTVGARVGGFFTGSGFSVSVVQNSVVIIDT